MTAADQPVLVVGMHRSGTSMLAGVLRRIGFDLGPEGGMMPAHPVDNPAGFNERLEVAQINDALLEQLGGSWWAPPTLRPGWERSSALEPLRARARAELSLLDPSRAAIKDPRMSLTLPFWRGLVQSPRCVICIRHPVEVVSSLMRRRELGIEAPEGALDERAWGELWRTYVNAALRHSHRPSRLIVDHRRLVEGGPRELERLAGFLGRDRVTSYPSAWAVEVERSLWRERTRYGAGQVPMRSRLRYRTLALAARMPSSTMCRGATWTRT